MKRGSAAGNTGGPPVRPLSPEQLEVAAHLHLLGAHQRACRQLGTRGGWELADYQWLLDHLHAEAKIVMILRAFTEMTLQDVAGWVGEDRGDQPICRERVRQIQRDAQAVLADADAGSKRPRVNGVRQHRFRYRKNGQGFVKIVY